MVACNPRRRLVAEFAVQDELTGRWTRLRVVSPNDYGILYDLLVGDPSTAFRWRLRGATPSPEQFTQLLWDGVLAQYALCALDSDEPIGLVCCYAPEFRHSYARIAAVVRPQLQKQGWPLEGVVRFVDLCFRLWPFRKLYLESLEFNLEQFGDGLAPWVVEEGRLRGHEWHDGQFWDMVYLALYRSTWEAQRPEVLSPIGQSNREQS